MQSICVGGETIGVKQGKNFVVRSLWCCSEQKMMVKLSGGNKHTGRKVIRSKNENRNKDVSALTSAATIFNDSLEEP